MSCGIQPVRSSSNPSRLCRGKNFLWRRCKQSRMSIRGNYPNLVTSPVWLWLRGFQLQALTPSHAALHSVSPSQSEQALPQQYWSNKWALPSPMLRGREGTSHDCLANVSVGRIGRTSESLLHGFNSFFGDFGFVVSLLSRHFAMEVPDVSAPAIA